MIAITMDLDWATPQQVDEAMQALSTLGVDKVTTFVPPYDNKKEQSEVTVVLLGWMGRNGVKNIGIHPVPFRDGHAGINWRAAISEAMEVIPKADFYRCHGLYDSHWLQKEMKDRGFKFCSNRCERGERWESKARRNAVGMWDIPIWWEDSIEFRGWNTIGDMQEFRRMAIGSGDNDTAIDGKIVINLHPHYQKQWEPWIAELMKHKPRLCWLREMVPNE